MQQYISRSQTFKSCSIKAPPTLAGKDRSARALRIPSLTCWHVAVVDLEAYSSRSQARQAWIRSFMTNIFYRLRRLARWGRGPEYGYDELAPHDSWNASHHEYLDNLGAPMLSSLLVRILKACIYIACFCAVRLSLLHGTSL